MFQKHFFNTNSGVKNTKFPIFDVFSVLDSLFKRQNFNLRYLFKHARFKQKEYYKNTSLIFALKKRTLAPKTRTS